MATKQTSNNDREVEHDRAGDKSEEDEVERYRLATEDALQQLDWCIGYLHGIKKRGLARALSHNRSEISKRLRGGDEPLPTSQTDEA